jgi:hypothetical protein
MEELAARTVMGSPSPLLRQTFESSGALRIGFGTSVRNRSAITATPGVRISKLRLQPVEMKFLSFTW